MHCLFDVPDRWYRSAQRPANGWQASGLKAKSDSIFLESMKTPEANSEPDEGPPIPHRTYKNSLALTRTQQTLSIPCSCASFNARAVSSFRGGRPSARHQAWRIWALAFGPASFFKRSAKLLA